MSLLLALAQVYTRILKTIGAGDNQAFSYTAQWKHQKVLLVLQYSTSNARSYINIQVDWVIGSVMVSINIIPRMAVCLLLFYVLSTSKVISGWVPTCDRTHPWQLYSAAPLGNQATSTMTQYPTQSHFPDTKLTTLRPMLIIPNICLENDKYQLYKSLV